MQVAGQPFGEENVLRAGYAYEQATSWRARQPVLAEDARPTPVSIDSGPSRAPDIDQRTLELIKVMAERAGLVLTEPQFAELCYSAP
jgi:aspartyl-tRNA(Asn)/glutamyl-tRNA(Gln) amidotransferase subunit A